MARNIEIKARVRDPARLRTLVEALADRGPTRIVQDDTFFPCATGRLKLRMFSADAGELIHYDRPDTAQPKASQYSRVPTTQPDALRATLAGALGTQGRVRKQRLLFLHGNTRIHLDDVEGLGHFVELEVVLRDDEREDAGIATARELMHRLDIRDDALVAHAYVDLQGERR